MYTKTEKWAAQSFKKFDFEEELVDGTLFEEGDIRWILEESLERTTKEILNSLGDDGLKRRREELKLVLNSLIAGGRGCSFTEVVICENTGRDFGNGSKALHSTERRQM
ncbi:hypothetical protein AVEN_6939-1 [Araneus ventricosus]|uniref:Uncharacterized protein n=1 Tax=Araneus ventricosus TaxID=182803 RepID=A0A4Y2LSG8_ARAVE|nr:hypothetical protein AVEN_6939-1 [Araneus ventricosus]